jgi:hypothetical protein
MPCRDRAPLAERMLGRPATIAVLVVAAGLLATWIPHYLTWPLWIDADCRLMMARAWDDGRAPYRDIVTFNFPGEIYLYWLIGRLFGWSRAPVAIHAFDAAFLVAFGAALVLWSRRALGRALPGALAFVAFLWVYLGFGGPVVGQRDWFGPALAFAAVFALQTSGSRRARAVSALLFAAGFVIRPHVVLFVPAALSAVLEPKGGVRPATPRRDAAEWIGLVAGGVVLAFVPLIAAGLVPDFVRSLSLAAPGGAYHDHDGERFGAMLATLRDEIAHAKNVVFPCASLGLAWGLRSRLRPLARTWAIASAGALLYAPLHPHPYAYLEIPLRVLTAVHAAIVVALVLAAQDWRPAARVAAVAVAAWLAIPGTPRHLPAVPEYCSIDESAAAVRNLARGTSPDVAPPGFRHHFLPSTGAHYSWDDYARVLDHLRDRTQPATRVAPLFRNWCFPALNGMSDRGPVFPTDQGVLWAWQLSPDYDRICAEALERTPDSVVVWVPDERGSPGAALVSVPEVERAVRRLYVPDAKFGAIEVWRRR